MSALSMRIQRLAPRLARRAGWPGASALTLAAAAAWIALVAVPAAHDEASRQRDAARQDRAMALKLAKARVHRSVPVDPAQSFAAAFPPAQSRPERLARLIATAREQGLVFRRAETRHMAEAALPMSQYQVVMPLDGSYAALREFIAQALLRDAALSLDALRLKRAGPQDERVQAELQFTFFSADERLAATPREDPR